MVEVTPTEVNPNGHVVFAGEEAPRSSSPRPSRGRVLAQLAMAALVLLTLVAGLLLLRVVRPGWVFSPSEPLVETLLDTTVDAGGLPGSWIPIAVERWTLPPGPAALTVRPLDGPQWVVVDGGTLVATVDGVEQGLEPDRALVVEAGQELVLRNAGTGEAAVIRCVASAGFVDENYDRGVISQQSVLETAATKAMPAGASRVVFVRLTLPPGSAVTPQTTRELDWFGVMSGRLGLTLTGEALPTGWKGGVEQEVAALERLPRLVPGTEFELRSTGDESLVLLRLTVLPVEHVSSEMDDVSAPAITREEFAEAPFCAVLAAGLANPRPAGGAVKFGRRRPGGPGDHARRWHLDMAESGGAIAARVPSRSPPVGLRRRRWRRAPPVERGA